MLDVPLDAIIEGRFAPQDILGVPDPIQRLFRQLRTSRGSSQCGRASQEARML
jgi:hypothetical protein